MLHSTLSTASVVSSDAFASLLGTLIALVIAVSAPFVVIFLRYGAKLLNAKARSNTAGFSREVLATASTYASMLVENINEMWMPDLIDRIQTGNVTSVDQVKNILYSWGSHASTELIKQMSQQGVSLSPETAAALVRRVTDNHSPVPGTTARTLIEQYSPSKV